ncbi:hypothetical protein GJAV_G00093320 [Gymnothorax javanicus]|nr:hypothetical protein GJAV_G00093320 [Gymnothorax javanicus]
MTEPVSASIQNGTANGSSRHEKSLGLLTMKFVTLLQEAKDGVLDLKVAADSLAVRQKRRIYDITNVLEGVGLIEKKTKNIIQWKGENSGCQTKETQERVELLKAQMAELELKEQELDNICNAFNGETLLAVIAPSGTQLEVPVPEMGQNGQKKYQVNLRSQSAPIQVMLINRETATSKPVVFSVPPPDDMSAIPNPLTPPDSAQKYPADDLCLPDHKGALSEQEQHLQQLAASSVSDLQMECNPQPAPCLMSEPLSCPPVAPVTGGGGGGPTLQPLLPLDMSTLLKLNSADQLKEEREGVADLIDELMSSDVFPLLRLSPTPGVDYNFNLDDNEGVCDLFDVQILNY